MEKPQPGIQDDGTSAESTGGGGKGVLGAGTGEFSALSGDMQAEPREGLQASGGHCAREFRREARKDAGRKGRLCGGRPGLMGQASSA